MSDILISVVVPILTAVISYLGARHQANTELQKVKEQQSAEMQRIKEQQNAELLKIKEQSKSEIEKIKTELDKQAELYEKNAQVDITKDIFGQMMNSTDGDNWLNQMFQDELNKQFKNSSNK